MSFFLRNLPAALKPNSGSEEQMNLCVPAALPGGSHSLGALGFHLFFVVLIFQWIDFSDRESVLQSIPWSPGSLCILFCFCFFLKENTCFYFKRLFLLSGRIHSQLPKILPKGRE